MAKFYTPTRLSENIAETPEGYLLCLAVPVARTGWQDYAEGECPLDPDDDGVVRVYRSPNEVFSAKTMASFQGKPVTIRHPNDFVAPHNWKELAKGIVQNVRKGDGYDADGEEMLVADILITDHMTIELVKNGMREVSCGYEAEYIQTGVGEGEQVNIVGNHIALVEEGRAGPAYAINDHKGKANMEKGLIERLKKKFGTKVVDEAMKEAKDESEKKEESKDESAASYDELVKMVKDLGAKIDGMGKAKDEEKEESKDEEEKPKKKDDNSEDEEETEKSDGESSLEERLKQLEAAVAKLLKDNADEDDEEESESESEDEESDESEDDDMDDSSLTGDTKARVAILAPGLKASKKEDIKQKALMTAFGTEEGRAAISPLIGGSKKLVLDSAEKINTLFFAASELMKAKRGTGLEGTKKFKAGDSAGNETAGVMTPEKMNEINSALWARK